MYCVQSELITGDSEAKSTRYRTNCMHVYRGRPELSSLAIQYGYCIGYIGWPLVQYTHFL